MSLTQDRLLTCLVEEKLDDIKHPTSEPISYTGIREEDGDSRDSGIVSDYQSPEKEIDTPPKPVTRKGLTDKTNTDVPSHEKHSQEESLGKTLGRVIEESPVSSRRFVQRLLSYSLLPSEDDEKECSECSPSPSCKPSEDKDDSMYSLSSFSCTESDIVWTPPKAQLPRMRSVSEERPRPTAKFRKRFTESISSEGEIGRKRSCAVRAEAIQSEISILEEDVFSPTDISPNASRFSESFTMSISQAESRCFMRTQSMGVLEMGECQQRSPKFEQAVEYSLPGVEHPQSESLAFRSISAETLANEIRKLGPEAFDQRYLLVDCRYPYEYEGGHVKCAVNIHDQNELEKIFFPEDPNHPIRKRIPIFYCEFSQKRGPGMALALRSIDRMRNEYNYPKVDYAEMYLLDQGYRKFWNDQCYKSECIPCGYVPMTHSAYVSSLAKYKWHKSKSTSQLVVREKDRPLMRKASLYQHRSLMQMWKEVETTAEDVTSSTPSPVLMPRKLDFTDSPESSNAD
ncbi:hypothetical protein Q1695_003309 [Nippostrongylus brasiliensis]|nr:hypothetical protein Q1695_003309 [Nippostrongylus brasiliensis]